MRNLLVRSSVAVALILATAIPAVADDTVGWYGRRYYDVGDKYLFVLLDNGTWTLVSTVKAYDNTEWKMARNTREYIELQLMGTDKFTRVRLYNHKMTANKPGSKTEWIQRAEGWWVK